MLGFLYFCSKMLTLRSLARFRHTEPQRHNEQNSPRNIVVKLISMAMQKDKKIQKTVSIQNRKAAYEYHLLDKYTTGIVLKGTEIKSIRMGKVSLSEAYCLFVNEELWARKMYISPYDMGNFQNHEARADRKLLLKKRELRRLFNKTKDRGSTIIPMRLFINDEGLAKLDIALAKGKKLYDKRETIKERESNRVLKDKLTNY